MSIHGFNVALSPGVASPVSPTRYPARELHVNIWVTGAKGLGPVSNFGDSTVTGSTGIVMSTPRPTTGLANAPSELVLGDNSPQQLLNVTEAFGLNAASAMSMTGFFIP